MSGSPSRNTCGAPNQSVHRRVAIRGLCLAGDMCLGCIYIAGSDRAHYVPPRSLPQHSPEPTPIAAYDSDSGARWCISGADPERYAPGSRLQQQVPRSNQHSITSRVPHFPEPAYGQSHWLKGHRTQRCGLRSGALGLHDLALSGDRAGRCGHIQVQHLTWFNLLSKSVYGIPSRTWCGVRRK